MNKYPFYEAWPAANGEDDPADFRVDRVDSPTLSMIMSWHNTEEEAEAEAERLNALRS